MAPVILGIRRNSYAKPQNETISVTTNLHVAVYIQEHVRFYNIVQRGACTSLSLLHCLVDSWRECERGTH